MRMTLCLPVPKAALLALSVKQTLYVCKNKHLYHTIPMTAHECYHCHKQFARAKLLENHLARKTPCLETHSYKCDKCSRSFKHKSSASRHRASCNATLNDRLEQAQLHIADLTRQLAAVPHLTSNVENHITHNHITNNNVIQVNINGYGSEQQGYLESMTYPELKKILKLSPNNESLLNMIKFIHRNKDHPENVNVKLDAKDSAVINVFKNSVWREEKTDPTVYDIICRNTLRFIDVQQQLSSGMAKTKFEALTEYLEKAEDMANSEDASLYSTEYAFTDLISKVKDVLL